MQIFLALVLFCVAGWLYWDCIYLQVFENSTILFFHLFIKNKMITNNHPKYKHTKLLNTCCFFFFFLHWCQLVKCLQNRFIFVTCACSLISLLMKGHTLKNRLSCAAGQMYGGRSPAWTSGSLIYTLSYQRLEEKLHLLVFLPEVGAVNHLK